MAQDKRRSDSRRYTERQHLVGTYPIGHPIEVLTFIKRDVRVAYSRENLLV